MRIRPINFTNRVAAIRKNTYAYKLRKKMRSAHFERYAEEGNRFIDDVANELNIMDHPRALRITRAVLHTLRDRLPADDAVEFAQGLPVMLKGIYFDQYDLSNSPVVLRTSREFIDYIREKNHIQRANDFYGDEDVIFCMQAVFRVLKKHMDPGQVEQVEGLLPMEICELIEQQPVNMRYHAL